MPNVQFINNSEVEITLSDIGVTIPAEGMTESDPDFLRKLVDSNDLRNRLDNQDVVLNDGGANMTAAEAKVYLSLLWQTAGRDDVTGIRVLASGQTLINGATTVTLGTFTRFPTERLSIFLFPTNDVNGLSFAEGIAAGAGDSMRGFFERTTNPNEFLARAANANAVTARTLDWAVVGVRL